MNPQPLFCPNATCPARGVPDRGHIRSHSPKEQRYRCTVCGKTFRLTQGTLQRVAIHSEFTPVSAIIAATTKPRHWTRRFLNASSLRARNAADAHAVTEAARRRRGGRVNLPIAD